MTPLPTRGEAARAAARRLADAGVPGAALDARLLLQEASGADAAALIARPERPLGPAEAERYAALLARRAAGEPVSRILGRREFYGRSFRLTPHVLDPRADTETLVAAALDRLRARGLAAPRVLDLGTGSGAVLVTLLAEWPGATGLGVDRSLEALRTARANARAHGVAGRAAFVAADWGSALAGPFDLIVANPPYVGRADLAALPAEVRDHDPPLALDGGADGLAAYRAIAGRIAPLLAAGAGLLVEVGAGQAGAVAELLAGLAPRGARARVHRDLAGRERVVALAPW